MQSLEGSERPGISLGTHLGLRFRVQGLGDSIGIMQHEMETTIQGLGFRGCRRLKLGGIASQSFLLRTRREKHHGTHDARGTIGSTIRTLCTGIWRVLAVSATKDRQRRFNHSGCQMGMSQSFVALEKKFLTEKR